MSKLVDSIINKAKTLGKTIVLCEGEDKRVVEAVSKAVGDAAIKTGVSKLYK